MPKVKFEDLLVTGAHYGHVTRKWHPNYKPFILMEKNGVHIINLEETLRYLDKALNYIQTKTKNKAEFLFVGTKKQARDIVQQEADRCSMFYVVERWLGGTLTNWKTISNSINRLNELENTLGDEKIANNLSKKELLDLSREKDKLLSNIGGIRNLSGKPDLLVIFDTVKDKLAVLEAKKLGIPIIAIADTNSDPEPIDFIIPGNDLSLIHI